MGNLILDMVFLPTVVFHSGVDLIDFVHLSLQHVVMFQVSLRLEVVLGISHLEVVE